MTRRDQELLDRQLRAVCVPQRSSGNGSVMLAIVMVFVAGVLLGNMHVKPGAPVTFSAADTLFASAANLTVAQ
jgi:hypothetical protein